MPRVINYLGIPKNGERISKIYGTKINPKSNKVTKSQKRLVISVFYFRVLT